MKITLVLICLLAITSFSISGCSSFGTKPSDKDIKRFENSINYNKKKQQFVNRIPDVIEKMQERNLSWKLFKEWFKAGKDRVPSEKLPEVSPDINAFLSTTKDLKVIWFGHSSFLLNMDGNIILVDPVFSESASPVSWMVKRFQEPVLKLEELPKVDYIVISHDHYDHLDMQSIKHFKEKKVTFVTPLGVGSHLKGWGIDEKNIIERDWWQSTTLNGVEFTATPAQHFSGRTGFNGNQTLWASWVLKTKNHNVFFSGDTGYDIHFQQIGERLGPFDVAFIENGQYNLNWREVHLLPEEGVKAFQELKAKKYFPVHWGMFELSLHAWYDPVEKLFNLAKQKNIEVVAPKLGQVVNLNQKFNNELWWNKETTTGSYPQAELLVCQN